MVERSVLMCSPQYYGVTHAINLDSDVEVQADNKLARTQWNQLKETLISLGVSIKVIKGEKKWADMVFTANAALIVGEKKAIVSRFKYPEREGESKFFKQWFDKNGWETYHPSNVFEGAGEAFYWKNQLLLGVGSRSDFYTKYALEKFVPGVKITDLYLTNPYFYHLDLAFTPIPSKNLIAYCPSAFNDEAKRKIRWLDADLLEVSFEDGRKPAYGCNAIPVGDNIIMNKGTKNLANDLTKKGLNIIELDLSEFHKMGGSARCLTLDLRYAGPN